MSSQIRFAPSYGAIVPFTILFASSCESIITASRGFGIAMLSSASAASNRRVASISVTLDRLAKLRKEGESQPSTSADSSSARGMSSPHFVPDSNAVSLLAKIRSGFPVTAGSQGAKGNDFESRSART